MGWLVKGNQIDDLAGKQTWRDQHGKWPRYMLLPYCQEKFPDKQDGNIKRQGTIRNLTKKPTFKIPFLRPYQVEGVTRINQLHSLDAIHYLQMRWAR